MFWLFSLSYIIICGFGIYAVIRITILKKELNMKRYCEKDLYEKQKLLEFNAYHDPLTNLYNRTYFIEELQRINNLRNYPLSIIVVDINNLKLVNDISGHNAGDALIKAVANGMKELVRQDDMIARVGGDEFIILLKNMDEKTVEDLSKRLKQACSIRLPVQTKVNTDISIGHTTLTKFTESLSDAINLADEYMYQDKLESRGTIQKELVDSLIEMMRQKDFHTQEHEKRTSHIAEKLGTKAGLKNGDLKNLKWTCLFHDIGKISIPDKILHKKSKLTKGEWEYMKQHTIMGFNILKGLRNFSPIANYVLYHHENWDGTGYNKNLKGDKIPLISRIIRIVDTFDAICHDRPYKKGKAQSTAWKEIERNSGIQFDPNLVKLFKEVLDENYLDSN